MRFAIDMLAVLAFLAVIAANPAQAQHVTDKAAMCSAMGVVSARAAQRRDAGESLMSLLDEAKERTGDDAVTFAAARMSILYAFRHSYYTPQMAQAYMTGDCLKSAGY